MLRRRAIVRPGKLGDVQRILITIDHQRHVGHIALVQSKARNPALRRPAAKMSRPISQSIRKLLRLPRRALLQAAKRGSPSRRIGRDSTGGLSLCSACSSSPLPSFGFMRRAQPMTHLPVAGSHRLLDRRYAIARRPRPMKLVIRALERPVIKFAPPAAAGPPNLPSPAETKEYSATTSATPQHERKRLIKLDNLSIVAHSLAIRRIGNDATILGLRPQVR